MKKVAILGPGLLGGSIALAVRERMPEADLGIWGRRKKVIEELHALGLSENQAGKDLAACVDGADLIVLATPIGVMAKLTRRILNTGKVVPGTLVTDVGSVKAPVVKELSPLFQKKEVDFLGSHPMAGSEKAGLEHARSDLFEGARCIVTPVKSTKLQVRKKVRAFWRALGMDVVELSPESHDDAVARISHLPHALASTLVLAATEADPSIAEFSGGGYQDTTRVASGGPEMWAEILLENRDSFRASVGDFQTKLGELLELLENEDHEGLAAFLRRAKRLRDKLKTP